MPDAVEREKNKAERMMDSGSALLRRKENIVIDFQVSRIEHVDLLQRDGSFRIVKGYLMCVQVEREAREHLGTILQGAVQRQERICLEIISDIQMDRSKAQPPYIG